MNYFSLIIGRLLSVNKLFIIMNTSIFFKLRDVVLDLVTIPVIF